jgi:hypothetical protein
VGSAAEAGPAADASPADGGPVEPSDSLEAQPAEQDAGACDVPVIPGPWVAPGAAGPIRLAGRVIAGGREPPHETDLGEGMHREVDGALRGAGVRIRAADGTVLSTARTGCGGRYELPAPADSVVFTQVQPVSSPQGRYTGFLLVQRTHQVDFQSFDMDMLPVSELETRLAAVGRSYDASRGWVVQSFNSTSLAGGEGIDVSGVPAQAYFSVTGTRTIAGNRLPPACPQGTPGVAPGEPLLDGDGGVVCYTDLLPAIFVSDVVPGTQVAIALLSPAGIACGQRLEPGAWLVDANTVTRLFADCAP